MPKIINTALKAKAKAKAWTFEAKAKATGPEAKAKAKAIKFGLEAKAWPRGLHHCQSECDDVLLRAASYAGYFSPRNLEFTFGNTE